MIAALASAIRHQRRQRRAEDGEGRCVIPWGARQVLVVQAQVCPWHQAGSEACSSMHPEKRPHVACRSMKIRAGTFCFPWHSRSEQCALAVHGSLASRRADKGIMLSASGGLMTHVLLCLMYLAPVSAIAVLFLFSEARSWTP